MQYMILGPLTILDGDQRRVPSAAKVRAMLAMLLVRSNEVVSTTQIIDELWGENAPRRVAAAVHVYVSQLRKILRSCRDPDGGLLTRAPGYTLQIPEESLDLKRFERLTEQGRRLSAQGCYEAASDVFQQALGLWRGVPLSDVPMGPILSTAVIYLEETRLAAIEQHIECDLALGKHLELVGKLLALTAEHPLREGFYRQLMLALYRSERQAEALKVYLSARNRLQEELGLEPCRALRQLQQAILTADGSLELAVPAQAS